MFTDKNHLRVEDPGEVEGNPVFIYLDAFARDEHFAEFLPEYQNLGEMKAHYTRGGLGDVKVKKFLNSVLQAELAPIRERRRAYSRDIPEVYRILQEGSMRAREKAAQTMAEMKRAMKINYFDDAALIAEQAKRFAG
jgi:tryptophanyl-tRNA synthetase